MVNFQSRGYLNSSLRFVIPVDVVVSAVVGVVSGIRRWLSVLLV